MALRLPLHRLHRRRRLELLLPLFIFTVSGLVLAYFQYGLFRANAARVEETLIPRGMQQYLLRSGERCIGKLSSTAEEDRLLRWQLQGEVRIREGGAVYPARIFLDSFFNPLQQLFQAVIRFEYRDYAVHIKSENTHPIAVDVDLKGPQLAFTRRLSLPGPVLLETISESQYALHYHLAESFLSRESISQVTLLDPGFDFKVTPAEATTSCAEEAFELELLRGPLQSLQPLLSQRASKAFQSIDALTREERAQ